MADLSELAALAAEKVPEVGVRGRAMLVLLALLAGCQDDRRWVSCRPGEDPAACAAQRAARGPTHVSGAEAAVQAMGFRDVKTNGVPFFGCGKGDSMLRSRRFTATNSAGARVRGVVCCGLFKRCTVRF